MSDMLSDLVTEYRSWCYEQGLPADLSADELYAQLMDMGIQKAMPTQAVWLRDFIERWDRACDLEMLAMGGSGGGKGKMKSSIQKAMEDAGQLLTRTLPDELAWVLLVVDPKEDLGRVNIGSNTNEKSLRVIVSVAGLTLLEETPQFPHAYIQCEG